MTEEQKEKYANFLDKVSEILGLNKPIDILRLCAVTDEYLRPIEKRITELEKEKCELLGLIQGKDKAIDELKAGYEVLSCSVGDFDKLQDKLEEEQRRNNGLSDSLIKSKEIITNLVKFDGSYKDDEEYQRKSELYDKMWEEAEQFLQEPSEW